MKNLYIAGGSEPGHELLDLVKDAGLSYRFLGFYDEFMKGPGIVCSIDELEPEADFLIAIGRTGTRQRLFERLCARGLTPATLVHPSSFVSTAAKLSPGVVVYPNCSVSLNAEIGANVIVNYNCSVSHGVTIGPHCNITPGVNLAGNVRVGARCFLGIGSAIIEKTRIADDVTVGANTTVIRDLTDPGTYAGSPARLIKPFAG